MASWLVCSTLAQAVQVRALAGDNLLCSWARHFTLTVPLSIQVYIHTYIHKLYLSSDFSVAYIASISDPNLLIKSYNIII